MFLKRGIQKFKQKCIKLAWNHKTGIIYIFFLL